MEKDEESGSPGWSASFFMQTTEDVARAFAAAAAAASLSPAAAASHSPRPSVVYSSKDESGSQLQRLKHHVSRILKGLASPPELKSGPYNPEILTSQKRQWANFQLQLLDHRVWKEPSKLFESMVVVGLPPSSDIQPLQNMYSAKMSEGVEVNAVERTPSMSELNEILLGQEHLKQNDLSFVFRLQVADDSTLYGCCILVEEIIQKPSGLISMISDGHPLCLSLSRHVLTTHHCYCILSRLPFFELHFRVLNSISTEERLERLTKQISYLDLESPIGYDMVEVLDEKAGLLYPETREGNMPNAIVEASQSSTSDSNHNDMSHFENENLNGGSCTKTGHNSNDFPLHPESEKLASHGESAVDTSISDNIANKQSAERHLPNAVLPLLRYQQCESSESSSSFQGSPSKDKHFRSDVDEAETEEASSSGQDFFSEHSDILESAEANNRGSLQIICEYYRLCCPKRGSTIKFHPLDHLHPLKYHRPDETALHVAGSTVDLRSFKTSLELAEANSALMAEEEAAALSVWTVSCLCGSLRLEHVLTLFAGALLDNQIVVFCSNLVGVKNKATEMQSKLTNVILVDADRNQVKSPTMPQLPQHRELYSCLSPYHDKFVGESYLGKRRLVYERTDMQVGSLIHYHVPFL